MKPATLIDPEEGQPLLDSSTTRRATPKVLAAVVALGLLGAVAVASSPGGAITSAAITSFKISDSTTVTCDSNEGFWAEVQSWLIPQFAGDIYGAVNAPIEDAINGEFTTLIDDYNLDTCGSS